MNKAILLIAVLLLAGLALTGCGSADFLDAQIVLTDANGAIYYPGALLRFETVLSSGTPSYPANAYTTKALSVMNVGTKTLTFSGDPAVVELSDQLFVPNSPSSMPEVPATLPFSITSPPAVLSLEPGQKADFVLRFDMVYGAADGDAYATLSIPATDPEDNAVEFAYEVYGLMTC